MSNISNSNDQGTFIFRSNVWYAYKFTAGAAATITSLTLDLDHTASNYINSSTYTGGIIRFYNDSNGVVGTQITGTLTYTSTTAGTGVTIYSTASGGAVTIPSAGTYWVGLTCDACANVDYQHAGSSNYTGSTGWATILSSTGISNSGNAGSSWGAPFSSITYGLPMMTIDGTLADTTAPTVSYFNPADNATAVGVDSTFEIAFNETIATSTGNIVLYKTSDDSTVETIDIAGALVTASSTTALVINPSVTLESETEYYFTIPATGVDDASGNSYAGITASTTWSFTTADVDSPIVTTLSPADEATDIAIDSNLVITFDEIVDVESGNITIKKSSDDSTVATIDITTGVVTGTGTTEITINPASDLEYNTSYYINIDATAFDDSSSNSYAGISNTTTWNFTTIADTPVVVSSTSIAGTSTSRRVTNLLKMGSAELAQELMRQYPNLFINQATPQAIIPTSPTSTLENGCKIGNINRTLRTGSEGEDVRELQTFLNCAGFPLALSGPGSVGNETIYFSTKTHNALVKFQESHVSDILTPLNLIRGTGIFGPSTRGFVNGL